jgi:hypothetical protein
LGSGLDIGHLISGYGGRVIEKLVGKFDIFSLNLKADSI